MFHLAHLCPFLLRSYPQTSTATLIPPFSTPAPASHSTTSLSSWFHGEFASVLDNNISKHFGLDLCSFTELNDPAREPFSKTKFPFSSRMIYWLLVRQRNVRTPQTFGRPPHVPALSVPRLSPGMTTSSATATACATWSSTCSPRSKVPSLPLHL